MILVTWRMHGKCAEFWPLAIRLLLHRKALRLGAPLREQTAVFAFFLVAHDTTNYTDYTTKLMQCWLHLRGNSYRRNLWHVRKSMSSCFLLICISIGIGWRLLAENQTNFVCCFGHLEVHGGAHLAHLPIDSNLAGWDALVPGESGWWCWCTFGYFCWRNHFIGAQGARL